MRPISTAGFDRRRPSCRVGKFAIIDGQHRTTSAAISGVECVPCQIVIAAFSERTPYW